MPKPYSESLTIQGAVVVILAAVCQVAGWALNEAQIAALAGAIVALVGSVVVIIGRRRANMPLRIGGKIDTPKEGGGIRQDLLIELLALGLLLAFFIIAAGCAQNAARPVGPEPLQALNATRGDFLESWGLDPLFGRVKQTSTQTNNFSLIGLHTTNNFFLDVDNSQNGTLSVNGTRIETAKTATPTTPISVGPSVGK